MSWLDWTRVDGGRRKSLVLPTSGLWVFPIAYTLVVKSKAILTVRNY